MWITTAPVVCRIGDGTHYWRPRFGTAGLDVGFTVPFDTTHAERDQLLHGSQ